MACPARPDAAIETPKKDRPVQTETKRTRTRTNTHDASASASASAGGCGWNPTVRAYSHSISSSAWICDASWSCCCSRSLWSASSSSSATANCCWGAPGVPEGGGPPAPYGQEWGNPAEPRGAPAPQGDPKWKDRALVDDTDTGTVDNTDNDEVDDGSEVSVHLAKGAAQRSVSMPIPFQRRLSDKAHNETNEFEVSYLSSDATQEDTHSRFAKWKIPSRKLWKARPMHK